MILIRRCPSIEIRLRPRRSTSIIYISKPNYESACTMNWTDLLTFLIQARSISNSVYILVPRKGTWKRVCLTIQSLRWPWLHFVYVQDHQCRVAENTKETYQLSTSRRAYKVRDWMGMFTIFLSSIPLSVSYPSPSSSRYVMHHRR